MTVERHASCSENVSEDKSEGMPNEVCNAELIGEKMSKWGIIKNAQRVLEEYPTVSNREEMLLPTTIKNEKFINKCLRLEDSTPYNKTPVTDSHSDLHTEFGERLHRQGMISKKARELRSEKTLRDRELEHLQYSYSPSINPYPRFMTRSVSPIAERLFNASKVARARIEQQRNLQCKARRLECTFRPQLNKITTRLVLNTQQHTTPKNNFELLFEDAERRKLEKLCLERNTRERECTFSPEISRSSLALERKGRVRQCCEKDNAVKELRDKPAIGRGPRTPRNEAIPIGEYLHSRSKKKLAEKHEDNVEQSKSHAHAKSRELVNTMKLASFAKIFNELDSDGTIIGSGLLGVSKEIARIYAPVFNEMKESGRTLNLEEFLDASFILYDTLTITDKSFILDYARNAKQLVCSKPTFHVMVRVNL
eukprot:TRINITY_DN7971_c0_g1_i4.p1 TRINITY_DN7971_c0_g1~~TRINITY_DN7971_c0_g1_i4.p1  ORF type:complete len:424 (+),score=52.29 TRINITY_DN7971_c0_g1_i4:322-1593(+)